MSRLIEIDPQVQQEPEAEGYAFGYYVFHNLPNIEVANIESTLNSVTDIETRVPLIITFKASPLIMMFCRKYSKMTYFVRIS